MKRLIFLLLFSFLLISPARAWETFPVSEATEKWTDDTHFAPQQIEFPEAGCLNSVTLLYDDSQTVTQIIIATNTVNPVGSGGIWHGVATSTAGTDLMFATFFRSSTYPDSAVCYTANSSNRFITSNNKNFYTSNASTSYVTATGWDQLGYSLNSYTLGSPVQAKDLWLDINDFTFGGSYITWYATPTSTCDFSVWPVIWEVGAADQNENLTVGAAVSWGFAAEDASANYVIATDWHYPAVYSASSSPVWMGDTTTVFATNSGVVKSRALAPGQIFFAKPWLTDQANLADNSTVSLPDASTIASGDTWYFVIAGAPNENGCAPVQRMYPDFTWPFVTTTPTNFLNTDFCADIDTSGTLGQVKAGLCAALQWLFKPSQQSIDNFTELKSAIERKPPFGYVAAYASTTASLTTTTPTTSVEFSFLTGFDWLTPLKTLFSWVIFLAMGIWIIIRLSRLQL